MSRETNPKENRRSGFSRPCGRILLVDDEPLVLEILELAFRQSGFEVVTSNTSQAALKQLDRSHFDGLITDVRLEHIDGFDLLSLARRHNPHMIAVLITGAPNDGDAVRARQLSAEYLVKPLSLSRLIGRVEELLQTRAVESRREIGDDRDNDDEAVATAEARARG